MSSRSNQFGTFGGVFTPSTLTILGVIMFLRFGQVVGEAGIARALIVVLSAKLITTLTALSISAIATNTRVEGGGAYFLISRSLGVEFGGAIGVVFFLAQAVSAAMYVMGFTEAFLHLLPDFPLSASLTASLVNLVVFVCVYIGAGWTIRLQYGILAVLLLALFSFYAGAIPSSSAQHIGSNMGAGFSEGENLFTIFALFFPAVTGIMAGVNMSGDLKKPAHSIPLGTLAAIGFTALIYLSMAWFLGTSRPRQALVEEPMLMLEIARWPVLINAGIFAATLSSALGSMMGAPRILQALARDNIFSSLRPFARGSGANNEPRRGIILTFAIAQAGVLLGDLNAIAPVITMFFLVTYGTINFACFVESMTKNPSYRPTFRLSHWATALLGALGCASVMLLIAPLPAIGAMLAMAGLHEIIRRKEIRSHWGDVQSGAAYERARKALLRLEEERYHPKNWRPFILAFSRGAWLRNHLAEFGFWLTAGRGLLSLGVVVTESVEDRQARHEEEIAKLRKFIRSESLEAFPAVIVEQHLLQGISTLLESHGIGGIRPNMVLLGWTEGEAGRSLYGQILRQVRELGHSLVLVKTVGSNQSLLWSSPKGTLDIWWRGGSHGPLMLLLAHLLVQNPQWRNRRIRVLFAAKDESGRASAESTVKGLIETARVRARAHIVCGKSALELMRQESQSAALVIMAFDPPEEGAENVFVESIESTTSGIKNALLISSGGGMSLSA